MPTVPVLGLAPRDPAVIRIDAIWMFTEPLDMCAGMETVLARVVKVFGAAHPHHAYPMRAARLGRCSSD